LSIYRGMRKLAPAHFVTLRDAGDATPQRYWNAEQIAVDGQRHRLEIGEDEALAELDALLRDAVSRRMVADVPLGAFLSGGLDSTAVVALMQAQSSIPVRTFTIGSHTESYNEAEAAKAVASHLATDHTELYVTPEQALAVVPRLGR